MKMSNEVKAQERRVVNLTKYSLSDLKKMQKMLHKDIEQLDIQREQLLDANTCIVLAMERLMQPKRP